MLSVRMIWLYCICTDFYMQSNLWQVNTFLFGSNWFVLFYAHSFVHSCLIYWLVLFNLLVDVDASLIRKHKRNTISLEGGLSVLWDINTQLRTHISLVNHLSLSVSTLNIIDSVMLNKIQIITEDNRLFLKWILYVTYHVWKRFAWQ